MSRHREASFRMQFLDEKDIPDILNLQAQVARCLPDPKIFHLQSEEDLREIFCLERSVIGVMADDVLAAYSIIRIPGEAADNLGRDLNLPSEELGNVAHLQAIAVHPAYRGSGLQRRMERAHLEVIEELGFKHICCTISPENPISLRNTLQCGFLIKGLRPKFEGWWRFILHKEFPYETMTGPKEIRIRGSDIAGQVDLLRRGFVGFKMAFIPGGFEVFYRHMF
jgi:GNAT superfamily N-acetyltransferase